MHVSNDVQMHRNGRVMMIVGVLGLLAALGWLLLASEPFPMWLIIAGGGLMFLGVGASIGSEGR